MAITRDEYMKNSSALHVEFYAQFITGETICFVKSVIGLEKLKQSKDPNLNDVPVRRWGQGRWEWDLTPVWVERCRELGATSKTGLPSPSTRTCVGKACAKLILQGKL